MAKVINKPILCVERYFDGERSIEDAFAEAYAHFFSHKEKQPKSSGDTFAKSKLTDYNISSISQEGLRNGNPNPAA